MSRPWSDEELAALSPRRSPAAIAKAIGRSPSAVARMAKRRGIPLRGTKASRRPGPSRPALSAKGCASPELIRAFIETHLKLVEREYYGQPFILEPWQIDDLIEPVFGDLQPDGARRVREALWGMPRDSGKSELSAAVALALMFLEPVARAKYIVIASSREQASLLFEKAKYMVLSNPMLRAMCDVRSKEIIVKETGQRFYTLPWDDAAAQAVHARLIIIDEYHVHRNSTVYYAARSGQTHEPNALLITISTAGTKRQGPLWDLRSTLPSNPRGYMHWIGADDEADASDPAVWKAANPQSWATPEHLQAAYDSLPVWEFERYHLNRFPQAAGFIQAFPRDMVMRNVGTPDIDPKLLVVFGVDAAPRRDRCALVVAQRDAEGHHHWQPFVWEPGRQMELDDFSAIEQQVRDLAATGLYIVRIVSDPAFMWLGLNTLKAEGYPVETMTQDNAHMCNVAGMLHKLLSGGLLHVEDERAIADLLNCSVEERPPYGWRIGKPDEDAYIDCAIAGGMASFILESDPMLNSSGPPVIVG